jgi:hypothetical protein
MHVKQTAAAAAHQHPCACMHLAMLRQLRMYGHMQYLQYVCGTRAHPDLEGKLKAGHWLVDEWLHDPCLWGLLAVLHHALDLILQALHNHVTVL